MKKAATLGSLARELSRDPRFKQAMARARRGPRGKERARVEQTMGVVSLLLSTASHFSKKKKARALDELREAINLLVQVSLLLKENVLDRPEVKKFFKQRSKELYVFARQCAEIVMPRKGHRALRPKSV